MIRKFVIFCFLFFQANIYSQAIDDFGTWWGAEVRKTFLKDFRVGVRLETRLNENSGFVKNFYVAPSIRYAPLKWLNISLGYRFDNRYQAAERYFTQRHRIHFDLGFSYEIKRFQFEYRNRTQLHWEDYGSSSQYPIMYNRNKLGASYKWPQLPFSSSVSGELWLPLQVNTELSKFRLTVCQEYRLNKKHRFQLRFVFQTDLNSSNPWRDYIISSRYIFAF